MNNNPTITKVRITIILVLSALTLSTCVNSAGPASISVVNEIGYTLSEPDNTIILPGSLREISGMSVIDSSTVACIQDENGIVFIFDISKSEIRELINFGPDGDYEGIAIAGMTAYVLRSDGVLYKIKNFESSSPSEKIELNGIKADNNEGLCFDKKNNRLLIAPKEKNIKGPGFKENHMIYEFDLTNDSLANKPVIKIDLSEVSSYIDVNNLTKPKKSKKKDKKDKPEFNFKPSEISIHPITGKIYILSGEELMLFVFNTEGKIEFAEKLNPSLFTMPEGIAFFSNGDMLISNEAGNKYPTIMRFNYKLSE